MKDLSPAQDRQAFSPFQCATFALSGLGVGILLPLLCAYAMGLAIEYGVPLFAVSVILISPHMVAASSLRKSHVGPNGVALNTIESYRAARPSAKTVASHPWTLFAYRFGAVAACAGVVFGFGLIFLYP